MDDLMAESADENIETDCQEILRVCGILEKISEQYAEDSPESLALRDAAHAFQSLQFHRGLSRAYKNLKATINGEKEAEINAKLKEYGIDPTDFEDDI